jgi:hypothetical protein
MIIIFPVDIQALWLKLAEVLDEEFTEDYNIWPMSEAIFPSRTRFIKYLQMISHNNAIHSIKIAVMNGRISTHSAEYNQLIEECKPLGIRNSVSQFLPQIERLCQEYARKLHYCDP